MLFFRCQSFNFLYNNNLFIISGDPGIASLPVQRTPSQSVITVSNDSNHAFHKHKISINILN